MKKGYFLVFLTAVISGASIFINKFGVSVINPFIFTGLKNLLVTLILTGLIVALKDIKLLRKLKGKQWLNLIFVGFIGGSLPFLLFFKGLSITSASQASFIHKTLFIFATLLAIVFLKEKIDQKFVLGGSLLLLGNTLLLKKLPSSLNQGDFFVLAATFLWALENVVSKHLLQELDARIVAWARMFFGTVFIFMFFLFTGQLPLLAEINLSQFFWVVITAIFLFGYVMTWYSGLKDIPVYQASAILLLGSPITTILTFVFERKVSTEEMVGGLIITLGIILIFGLKHLWGWTKELKSNYVRS